MCPNNVTHIDTLLVLTISLMSDGFDLNYMNAIIANILYYNYLTHRRVAMLKG